MSDRLACKGSVPPARGRKVPPKPYRVALPYRLFVTWDAARAADAAVRCLVWSEQRGVLLAAFARQRGLVSQLKATGEVEAAGRILEAMAALGEGRPVATRGAQPSRARAVNGWSG